MAPDGKPRKHRFRGLLFAAILQKRNLAVLINVHRL